MKKFSPILILLFLVSILRGQTTIATETFENTLNFFSITGTGHAFLTGASTAPVLPAASNYAVQGSYGLGVTNGTATLTSPALNTSSFANIRLSLRLAAFSLTATAGLDQLDRVRVAISTDGGSFFMDIVSVTGAASSNSYWSYSGTGMASSAYPTAVILNAASTGSNPAGYSTITITNVPAQPDVRIRISLNSNFNERWVIDDFTLSGVSVLPVKLISFSGNIQNNNRVIEWKLAAPEDASRYELQRSIDGRNFVAINTQIGNSAKAQFNFTDASYDNGKTYYRLKIEDRDGSVTYSNIIIISAMAGSRSVVYPNPLRDKTTLQINDIRLKGTTAKLVNLGGHAVKTFTIKNDFELIDMSDLPPGIYLLRLTNGDIFKLAKE